MALHRCSSLQLKWFSKSAKSQTCCNSRLTPQKWLWVEMCLWRGRHEPRHAFSASALQKGVRVQLCCVFAKDCSRIHLRGCSLIHCKHVHICHIFMWWEENVSVLSLKNFMGLLDVVNYGCVKHMINFLNNKKSLVINKNWLMNCIINCIILWMLLFAVQ